MAPPIFNCCRLKYIMEKDHNDSGGRGRYNLETSHFLKNVFKPGHDSVYVVQLE